MIPKSKFLAVVSCIAFLALSTGCAKLKARDEMNKGVQAYRNNHYAEAVRHFKEAVELDPTNKNARLYLATSYMIQWVPGADSPDNKKNYDMAQQTFNEVLKDDPTNSLALASMASMAFNSASAGTDEQKKVALEDAKKWNQRRIEADPRDAEAYYYLGVINWADVHPVLNKVRHDERLPGDYPGPLKDAKIKEDLKGKYEQVIDNGVENLNKCLQYDKENEDAMSYINLLYREKANLEDSPDAAKADVAKAEDWSNRSLDMKRLKASRPAKTQTS